MGRSKYSAEFKDEAIKQVTERGYAFGEVAQRLGITRESDEGCQGFCRDSIRWPGS